MVYFFYGADAYRLRQKLNTVIAQYRVKHQSGLNFGRFDFNEEGAFEKLKNFIEAHSMFAEKKLAVAENLFEASAAAKGKFLTFIERSDILKTEERFIVAAQEIELNEDKKKKDKYALKDDATRQLFKKLVSRPIANEEFDFLAGAKLENWIKTEVSQSGGEISLAAVRKLAAFVGPDLWQMKNEVDKLISYKVDKPIMEDDIDLLVNFRIERDIFGAIDALASRQKAAAFRLLHQNLAQGDSVIALLSMLIYQFHNLLLVKSQIELGTPFYQLGQKIKIHPFVLRKTFEQSKNFSLAALKKIYERLLETDLGIKSGQIEPLAALDLLVGEIAS